MSPILLVDGDRNFREALAIALRLEGATVETAGSEAAALAALEGKSYALVAVDSLLPRVDELLAHLTRSAAQVVVTGPHREILESAAARHRLPVLEKPFGAEALGTVRR